MKAIHMHVHVPRQPGLPKMGIEGGLRRMFRVQWVPRDASELAAKYREWDIFGVIFSVDTETTTGNPRTATTMWPDRSRISGAVHGLRKR